MAVGLPLKTTYANGDVYSASDVNDTNGTVNLLTSTTLSIAAAKNFAINGGMDVWQRGTSVSVAANVLVYTADRWQIYNGPNQAMTVSRQATGDTTNLPFIQYCARVQRNSGQTGTTETFFSTPLETTNSIPFVGKTVTVSFYARRGANYSPTSNNFKVNLVSGTGTDQNITTYTSGASVATVTNALTTTWTRYTVTGTVGATATELRVDFAWTPTGTAGTNDYFEITGVQLELGSTATTFSRAGGTIQGELAACQRYYQRVSAAGASGNYSPMNITGVALNSTTAYYQYIPYVPFRSSPTSVDFSTVLFRDSSNASAAISNISLTDSASFAVGGNITSTGMTGGRWIQVLANNSTSAYVGFSAEL